MAQLFGQTEAPMMVFTMCPAEHFRYDGAATAEADRFGWHHTGEIGYLDGCGWLFIVDRAKHMIITGGFNVYLAEVEQGVVRYPGVRDCAVVGLPDAKWGEQVTAVVQADPDEPVDVPALRAFVKGELGGVKTPKVVEMWTDLPRSKVGSGLEAEIKKDLLGWWLRFGKLP